MLLDNDITNAWQVSYNILGGLYEYNMYNDNSIISEELKLKRRSISSMKEIKDDSEEESSKNEQSINNNQKSITTLYTAETAFIEVTRQIHLVDGVKWKENKKKIQRSNLV